MSEINIEHVTMLYIVARKDWFILNINIILSLFGTTFSKKNILLLKTLVSFLSK